MFPIGSLGHTVAKFDSAIALHPHAVLQCYLSNQFLPTGLCNGIVKDDPNVCGGHGTCVAPNTCVCDKGWVTSDCSQVARFWTSDTCSVSWSPSASAPNTTH